MPAPSGRIKLEFGDYISYSPIGRYSVSIFRIDIQTRSTTANSQDRKFYHSSTAIRWVESEAEIEQGLQGSVLDHLLGGLR